MKLKDIFPRWLFRERSYGELELGGGSFAHLTEDVADGYLITDFGLFIGADFDRWWNGDGGGDYASLDSGGLSFSKLDGRAASIYPGQLRLEGAGTNYGTVTITRGSDNTGIGLTAYNGDLQVGYSGQGIWLTDPSNNAYRLHIDGAGVLQVTPL